MAVLRTYMRSIVTDRVMFYVGRSVTVTLVSRAKTAEPFWLITRVGPGNHVLDGSPDPPWEVATWGKGRPQV